MGYNSNFNAVTENNKKLKNKRKKNISIQALLLIYYAS